MSSNKSVPSRSFTWEGIKVTAPGGDLRRLFRSGPTEIWEMFKSVNSQIPPNVHLKLRSCLTEVYVGYLQEAKILFLLSAREAEERKKRWKDAKDWKRLENRHGYEAACTTTTTTTNTTFPRDPQSNIPPLRNLAAILNSLSTIAPPPTNEEANAHKKRKFEWIVEPSSPPSTPAVVGSIADITQEESSKLWLDYNLRSVLERHPPSIPRDPNAGHAVERARPYLLSIKTRLVCLLSNSDGASQHNELAKAIRDLDTAWECLSVVRGDGQNGDTIGDNHRHGPKQWDRASETNA